MYPNSPRRMLVHLWSKIVMMDLVQEKCTTTQSKPSVLVKGQSQVDSAQPTTKEVEVISGHHLEQSCGQPRGGEAPKKTRMCRSARIISIGECTMRACQSISVTCDIPGRSCFPASLKARRRYNKREVACAQRCRSGGCGFVAGLRNV